MERRRRSEVVVVVVVVVVGLMKIEEQRGRLRKGTCIQTLARLVNNGPRMPRLVIVTEFQ